MSIQSLEEAVLQLQQNQSEEAFRYIYDNTRTTALACVRKYCSIESEYEDLLQETYLSVHRNIGALREPQYIKTWVGRIAANVAIRYSQKKKPYLFSELAGEDDDAGFDIEDSREDANPSIVMDRKAVTGIVEQMMSTLSENQRMALWMVYGQEIKIHEMAEMLGVSDNTIKSRLHQGRKKLESRKEEFRKLGLDLSIVPIAMLISVAFKESTYAASSVAASAAAAGALGMSEAVGGTGAAAGTGATAGGAGTTGGTLAGVAAAKTAATGTLGGMKIAAIAAASAATIGVAGVGAVHIVNQIQPTTEAVIEESKEIRSAESILEKTVEEPSEDASIEETTETVDPVRRQAEDAWIGIYASDYKSYETSAITRVSDGTLKMQEANFLGVDRSAENQIVEMHEETVDFEVQEDPTTAIAYCSDGERILHLTEDGYYEKIGQFEMTGFRHPGVEYLGGYQAEPNEDGSYVFYEITFDRACLWVTAYSCASAEAEPEPFGTPFNILQYMIDNGIQNYGSQDLYDDYGALENRPVSPYGAVDELELSPDASSITVSYADKKVTAYKQ